jgi:hypothetical protein
MIGGYIEQPESPPSLRDAGPPNAQVLVALAIAIVVSVAIWGDREPGTGVWFTLGAIAFALTAAVAIADRDGWVVREAMAWLAETQRSRWVSGRLPETSAEALAWIEDPANRDVPILFRVSALIGCDRWDEAAALLERYEPLEPQEVATQIRMRAIIASRSTGHVDQTALRAAAEQLPKPEARYQLLSAAWTQVMLDIAARRPWRPGFARVSRELRPYPLRPRIRAWIAAEQMLAPIACIAALGIAVVISALD